MGPFAVVVADPAWQFGDKRTGGGMSSGATQKYDTMPVDDICRIALPPITKNAYLFLWRVSAMVEEAYRVCRAWGFVPKSEIVWRKLTANGNEHFGMGHHVRAAHETCIVATRGQPMCLDRSIRSVFSAKVGEHSKKPDEFYDIVERLTGAPLTPAVELFARRQRPGWTCLGSEMETPTQLVIA